MREEIREKFLRMPVYWLFHTDPTKFTLSSDEIKELKAKEYVDGDFSTLVEALAWAKAHPEFDFVSLLPNVRYSNQEVHEYLGSVHDLLIGAV